MRTIFIGWTPIRLPAPARSRNDGVGPGLHPGEIRQPTPVGGIGGSLNGGGGIGFNLAGVLSDRPFIDSF